MDLSYKIHRNLNHDEQGCAAQDKRNRELADEDLGQDTQANQIYGTQHSQTSDDVVKIVCRIFTRTNTGNKTAVLFQVLGCLFRIKDNRSLEESKESN